jgi:hypothetical protein
VWHSIQPFRRNLTAKSDFPTLKFTGHTPTQNHLIWPWYDLIWSHVSTFNQLETTQLQPQSFFHLSLLCCFNIQALNTQVDVPKFGQHPVLESLFTTKQMFQNLLSFLLFWMFQTFKGNVGMGTKMDIVFLSM